MIYHLIPNTGIQYLSIGPISDHELRSWSGQINIRGEGGNGPGEFLAMLAPAGPRSSVGDAESEEEPSWRRSQINNTHLLEIIDQVVGQQGAWIPLPFDHGGCWVAIHLRRPRTDDPQGAHVLAAIAVDTTLQGHGSRRGLTEQQVGQRQPDPCGRAFWTDRESVLKAVEGLRERCKTGALETNVERIQLAIASLASFLRDRGLRLEFPAPSERVGLQGERQVDVDMIVDLGNSRTCVLLLEDRPEGGTIMERLRLIYPEDPLRQLDCPLETHFAFVEHRILDGSEECEASPFAVLSPVAIGSPAIDRFRETSLDPQALGMSSPKRYLWDRRDQVPWTWKTLDRRSGVARDVNSSVMRWMDPIDPMRPPVLKGMPGNANHPRFAGMTWIMLDLLEQAFRQINSGAWRGASDGRPGASRRRRIANVVIMYPAGMHSEELDNFRDACRCACRLWARFRRDPIAFREGVEPDGDHDQQLREPRLHVVCDEGLAIQLCWIFDELMHHHGGRIGRFMECLGRAQEPPPESQSIGNTRTLRVASLDIGGGTIDLAIADYQELSADRATAGAVSVACRRIFNDGASRAGDEIVRVLLQDAIIPSLMEHSGVSRERWLELLSTQSEGQSAARLRRRLVRQLWIPLAAHYLGLSESAEVVAGNTVSFKVGGVASVTQVGLDLLNRHLGMDGSLAEAELKVNRERMRRVVESALATTIRQFSDVVDQYECDVLIVGGRPSSNPAVRELIKRSMAVPPGQIRFLGEYRVGRWYPFSSADGVVGDAKTCGVVGAAIAFAALHGSYDQFRLIAEGADEPGMIFGLPRRVGEQVRFGDEDRLQLGVDIEWMPQIQQSAGLEVYARRIDDPRAEARLVYQARLRRAVKDRLHENPAMLRPVKLRFERRTGEVSGRVAEAGRSVECPFHASSHQDRLSCEITGEIDVPRPSGGMETFDASREIEFIVRCLADTGGYWLDTGRLEPRHFHQDGEE